MAVPPAVIGYLDKYLQSISPEALGLLLAQIEHARRKGTDAGSYGDLIIETTRRLAREGKVQVKRLPDARRLFFSPLEPYLVDGSAGHKQRARIERRSLDLIHRWLERDLMPTRVKELFGAADLHLRKGDFEAAEPIVRKARSEAGQAIAEALREADTNDRVRMRISAQVGSGQVLEDARDMIEIFENEQVLATVMSHMGERIADLDEGAQRRFTTMLNGLKAQHPSMLVFAMAILMDHLDKPAQIVRLAKHAAGTDVAAKLRSVPFAVSGDLVIYDVSRISALVSERLEQRAPVEEISGLLFKYYALAHGLRVETEIVHNDAWAISLAKASGLISERLGPVIAAAPRHIKAALVPRRDVQIHAPEEADLAAAEYALGLMHEARLFISELALNDLIARTSKEVDQYMDLLGDFVVERLRDTAPSDHAKGRALLDGAVRLTRMASGHELADLLHRSGNAALQSAAAQSA